MSSKIFGIGVDELRPTHDLEISRGSDGAWAASQSFHCRFTDHANVAITDRLQQGTKLTSLDPTTPILYDFISLSGHKVKHQRGGITKISCTFSGSSENDGFGGGASDRAQSYSFRGTLGQRSILQHPLYLSEITTSYVRRAISALWHGEGKLFTDPAYSILRKADEHDYAAGNTFTTVEMKWIDKIDHGLRFYDGRQIEWTVSSSNKEGMSDTDLTSFGKKVEEPPGNPPKPSDWPSDGWWHFSDIGEEKDDNSSSFTRSYTLHAEELDEDLYDYTV